MTAMARHFDNLGSDFDQRWKRSSRGAKRELIGELRELYIFLEDDDMPLLAGTPASPVANSAKPAPAAVKKTGTEQGSLFQEGIAAGNSPSENSPRKSPVANTQPAGAPRQDNPFLPKSVLDRLHDSQSQASAGLRELMQTDAAVPVSHEKLDLERELRLKLGPVIETLIEAQMEQLKSELRVRMRAEMDRLIAEQTRKA
ncbi:MAG: hypothetical protein PSX71_02345 [bacterium]|nr:hypothetical protein [bacterium]